MRTLSALTLLAGASSFALMAGCSGLGGLADNEAMNTSGESDNRGSVGGNGSGVADDGSDLNGTGGSGGAPGTGAGGTSSPPDSGSNVNLSGSQDFGYFRRQLADGQVPRPDTFDAAGFFAEHHTALPPPTCGERICIQPMMGVMGNLTNGEPCTLLQLGLKTPLEGDPGERPPLTLSVVIDTSGSMASAGKIDFVRDGLEQLIDSLHDADRLSVITFNNDQETVFPMTPIITSRSDARGVVQSLQAAGGTNLYAGLEAGYASVSANYDSARQNRVILLSDGLPTVGNTSSDNIVAMSRAQNSDGIGLTTIGLGTDFNPELMRELALQADGNYYFLENASAVEEVFQEEINYFTVPIAFDLSIGLTAGEDYTLGRAYGSPFWEGDSTGGKIEVPSAFIAHRESDDTSEGRRGGGSALLFELMANASSGSQTSGAVATVDFSFREPGSNDIIEDHVNVTYPMAPWDIPMAGYFSGEDPNVIQKSFVMLNIYVGIEEACTTFYEPNGNVPDAIRKLQRLRAAVVDYNDGSNDLDGDSDDPQDDDLRADVELLDDLIQVMRNNGFDPEPDPNPPEDPWPAD